MFSLCRFLSVLRLHMPTFIGTWMPTALCILPTRRPWPLGSVSQRKAPVEPGRQVYLDIIRRHANFYRLEEALVKAVIKVESDYQPRIVSSKGAQGLMQLIPETARDLKVDNPFDPSENIRGGSEYLRQMLDLFNNNVELALAAYNSGPDYGADSTAASPL